MFSINEVPKDIPQKMINKKIWTHDCEIVMNQMVLLTVDHYDFLGNILPGQLIVCRLVAKKVVLIFKELFDLKFPIEKIKLIDEYDGDDERSMADNNSSCFNYRNISGSRVRSMHSYGLAIDINPLQNPFLQVDSNKNTVIVSPQKGVDFLNRNNQRSGMVEPIVKIFKRHGFDVWGGNWNSPIDYHHFQVERVIAEKFFS